MKTRIYTRLLILFTLLSVILILLLKPWTSTGAGFESILPKNLDGTTSIRIASTRDTMLFENAGDGYRFGNEKLNQEAVENLLIASTRLSLKSIIPREDLSSMNSVGEISFFRNRKLIGEFEFASVEHGFIVFRDGSENVFGVELIGYGSHPLGKIFSTNPDHYREHLLIDLLPDEISSVQIFPISGKPFRAEQDSARNIRVWELPGERDVTADVSEEKIRLLFSYFNAIRYNEIAGIGDNANNQWPEAAISELAVLDINNNRFALEIYEWIHSGERTPDLFRALVRFNGRDDYLSVDYFYLDLLMRGLENYYR